MITFFRIAVIGIFSLSSSAVYAYGSASSATHCDKPVFTEYQPAVNKYLQSFNEFSFVASSNTTPGSIEVNVNAGQNKQHFSAKNLEITAQKSGKLEVSGKLDRPIEQGFVRINITAHSKPGCEKTDGYLVRIH